MGPNASNASFGGLCLVSRARARNAATCGHKVALSIFLYLFYFLYFCVCVFFFFWGGGQTIFTYVYIYICIHVMYIYSYVYVHTCVKMNFLARETVISKPWFQAASPFVKGKAPGQSRTVSCALALGMDAATHW